SKTLEQLMKNTITKITVGCLASFLLTTGSEAQNNVSSMVRTLKGVSTYSAPVQKRSVSISSSSVRPKGNYSSTKKKPASSYSSNRSSSSRSSSSYSSSRSRHSHSSSTYHAPEPVRNEVCYHVDPSSQLSTNRIQFQKNSARIDHSSYHFLYELAAALQSHTLCHHRFVIEGHASAEGSWGINQSLSQRRANSIFDFLVARGVHPSRLLSVGHGEEHAQYSPGAPEYLRANDRKVMVFKLAE
ncbi:MAG: OmpA family protein, partial [Verrucomicrobiales bacterium]|nr:OmpA family protein [Verrucomicrobiales bacterium]